MSSFEFSFPGFREHSYPVLQTSAQSFEVRARMNRFECKQVAAHIDLFQRQDQHRDKSLNVDRNSCACENEDEVLEERQVADVV